MLQIDPQTQPVVSQQAPAPMELRPHWPWRSRPPAGAAPTASPPTSSRSRSRRRRSGKLDLRLELRGERLLAEVTTPAGRPHVVASGASERLRANLEAVGLEATVKVRPRHTPLDLYA